MLLIHWYSIKFFNSTPIEISVSQSNTYLSSFIFKENMYSYLTSTDARQTLRWRRLLTTSKNTEGRFSKQGSPMREELRPRPFGITFFGAKSLGWSVWLWKHRNACITGEHPFLMYIEFSIWSEIKRWWFDFFLNENHWKYNWIVNIQVLRTVTFKYHLIHMYVIYLYIYSE